jgi:hypothetical protein
MPKMKTIIEKISNEMVINVLYLFSVATENMNMQPVAERVGNKGHKMMNHIPRMSQ